MSALEHLALDPARFVAEIYGRRPEVTATGRDYSWLGSLDRFDELINDSLLPTAAFRLVRDGSTVPATSYTKSFGGRRADATRVADPALVFDHFASGATIVLEGLHRYSPSLRDLCRDLERELREGTQVNAYITPPSAQGFATHVDAHDVFVVQVHGTKRWSVFAEEDETGQRSPLIERDLQVGECLYIPAGFAHSAATGVSASAHLTIGILPTTASRIKNELIELMDIDESAIDLEALDRGDFSAVSARLVKEARDKLASIDERELAHRLRRLSFTTRHHSLRGHLHRVIDADRINDSDRVAVRVAWDRADSDGDVIVLLPDRELRFDARLAPALDVVLQGEPFLVADLKGHLDEEDRRAMVARLIREGLLELR